MKHAFYLLVIKLHDIIKKAAVCAAFCVYALPLYQAKNLFIPL